MKYVLDILLVIGVLWLGQLWNGERKAGIALGDEIEMHKAKVTSLEKDLAAAKEAGEKASAELASTKTALEGAQGELAAAASQLEEKTKEAEGLKELGLKLRTRVAELEGYKSKAIVAEMPKPPQ